MSTPRNRAAGAMKIALAVVVTGAMAAWMPLPPSDVADAAMKGDRAKVEQLLKSGADVNAPRGDGMTALHWAAERGDAEMAQTLLRAGAIVEAVTRIGSYTPLHIAAKGGNGAVVKLLLDAGANVKTVTSNTGATALHLAAASGSVEAVNLLIAKGADVNAKEKTYNQTPLMFAASLNRADVIKALIAKGADPNVFSRTADDARRAADAAATQAQNDMKAAFDKINGAPNKLTPTQVQAIAEAGRVARLNVAAPTGAVAAQADAANPNVDPADAPRPGSGVPPGGLTALHHAARQGHVEAVRALIEGGANINAVSLTNKTSPLLMATESGQWDAALALIEKGANPNLIDSSNNIGPLWATINTRWQPRTEFPQPQEMDLQKAGYLDVMEALLKAGANPNQANSEQPFSMGYSGCGNSNCGLTRLSYITPFWRAAHGADVEAMRLLVKYNADPKIARGLPPANAGRAGGGGGGGGAAGAGRAGGAAGAGAAGGAAGAAGAGRAGGGAGGAGAQVAAAGGGAGRAGGGAAAPAAGGRAGAPAGAPAAGAAAAPAVSFGGANGGAGGPANPAIPTAPALAIHAAAGIGFGEGVGAGNTNRFMPNGWLPSIKYLVEELKFDINARDDNGFTPLHFAAARGDNELILWMVEHGADVTAVSRNGFSTADMANGPQPRITPMPATVALLESLGSKNNHRCASC